MLRDFYWFNFNSRFLDKNTLQHPQCGLILSAIVIKMSESRIFQSMARICLHRYFVQFDSIDLISTAFKCLCVVSRLIWNIFMVTVFMCLQTIHIFVMHAIKALHKIEIIIYVLLIHYKPKSHINDKTSAEY